MKIMKEMWIGGQVLPLHHAEASAPGGERRPDQPDLRRDMGHPAGREPVPDPFSLHAEHHLFRSQTWLHTKCNAMLQQKGVGSFARQHEARKEEHMWAAGELEAGKRFVKVMPILWVYGANKEAVSESLVRAKRLWEDSGYGMQEDRGILPILFISSLPLGLYNIGRNVDNLERSFIAPTNTVSALLPVQADFAGGGAPYLLLAGRKGQVCTLDLFDKHANNHNAFVAAHRLGQVLLRQLSDVQLLRRGGKDKDHRYRRLATRR